MNWHGINEFVAVAETQSFSQAAKKLNISTAQVSRQITALEKRLKVTLFHRTTRRVVLSEDAHLFYQHCRPLIDGLNEAQFALSQLQRSPTGKIKLSAPITYGEQTILPMINNFILQYPDIEIVTELSNKRVDLIEEGIDLAIRLGNLEDSRLIAKKLSSRSMHVCASPTYLNAHPPIEDIDTLVKHNCLLGSKDHWQFVECEKQRNIKVTGNIRCNSGFALIDAAIKGIGLVQLPDYYIQPYLMSGQLIAVLEEYKIPDQGIWAVFPENRFLSPKVRILIDYLIQNIDSDKSVRQCLIADQARL